MLLERFPDRFQLSSNILRNVSTQEEFDLADNSVNPMSVLARLVQVWDAKGLDQWPECDAGLAHL